MIEVIAGCQCSEYEQTTLEVENFAYTEIHVKRNYNSQLTYFRYI